jgi:N-acetylglucosamine-6-phosphate deacetylase
VTVRPGYVDLQVNGVGTVDFSVADGEEWIAAGQQLRAAGVTGYLATICSTRRDRYAAALARVQAARDTRPAGMPQILGVHLEGPFLGGALGAHPERVVGPMELEWLLDLLDAFPGLIRFVTLAPEADSDFAGTRALVERGVVVALGHTACTYEDAVAGAAAGASITTHLFNGMGPLHQRAPGIIGAALDPRVPLRPTLIGDLVHVHPALVATVFAAGEPILVSDAVATGVDYFDAAVTESAGAAYLPDGTLTGGVILLDAAVRNVVGLGVDPADALAAASDRPAGVLGLPAAPGRIELDDELRVRAVELDGEWSYGPWS